MIIKVEEKISKEDLQKASEDLDGYIKWVVDLEKGILTAGGLRHYQGEDMLLQDGSKQENLWGGGLDLETGEIDFDSMINIRPNQGNSSNQILDLEIRQKAEELVRKLLQ